MADLTITMYTHAHTRAISMHMTGLHGCTHSKLFVTFLHLSPCLENTSPPSTPALLSSSLLYLCVFPRRVSIINQHHTYFTEFLRYAGDTLHMYAAGVPTWLLGEAPSKKCWISPLLAYVRRLNEALDPAGEEEEGGGGVVRKLSFFIFHD